MSAPSQPPAPAGAAPAVRSVQSYLDETPVWRDGTGVLVTPMTRMQWRIWWLAVAGKFFEGYVVFVTGVALPLLARQFGLDATGHGLVGAASLFGILVGASALGGLADRFGRRPMFVLEMGLFAFFLVAILFASNAAWLVVCLFGMGLALGCDYPTAHLVISESTDTRRRARLVLGAFAFQAVGALVGMAAGVFVLAIHPSLDAWQWMYASAIVPAVGVTVARLFVTESPSWLVARGERRTAEEEMERLLYREPRYPVTVELAPAVHASTAADTGTGYGALFRGRNLRATILASVPWFLQDLGTYGIGIFTPTILAATLGHERAYTQSIADLVARDLAGARGAALVDVLLIVGIVGAICLADRVGRIRLQVLGFIGCAIGLFVAAQSDGASGTHQLWLIYAGFMLFNFSTNLGPNAQTYLLAGEVFPTAVRGKGAGFAASFAKIGAVLTAFLFPILLVDLGTARLLYLLCGASLLGAWITWRFRIETTGVSLEDVK